MTVVTHSSASGERTYTPTGQTLKDLELGVAASGVAVVVNLVSLGATYTSIKLDMYSVYGFVWLAGFALALLGTIRLKTYRSRTHADNSALASLLVGILSAVAGVAVWLVPMLTVWS